jgi:hypothetical protein
MQPGLGFGQFRHQKRGHPERSGRLRRARSRRTPWKSRRT